MLPLVFAVTIFINLMQMYFLTILFCFWTLLMEILFILPEVCSSEFPFQWGGKFSGFPLKIIYFSFVLEAWLHCVFKSRLFCLITAVLLPCALSSVTAVVLGDKPSLSPDCSQSAVSLAAFKIVLCLWCSALFTCWVTQSCLALCDTMDCSMPLFPIFLSARVLKLMSVESVMPSKHFILCHPLLLLPSIFLSIRVFSSESALHIRWPKYWSSSFNNSLPNEYSGLLSFWIDWFNLLAVQGTLRSLLQHQSLKALILWSSAFLMVCHIPTWVLEKP